MREQKFGSYSDVLFGYVKTRTEEVYTAALLRIPLRDIYNIPD